MKKGPDKLFIEGAIHVVAQFGIENARTKQMAEWAGFSEATLFRAFGTKKEILSSAFLYVDKRLSDILSKSKLDPDQSEESFELSLYGIWHKVYRHLIENREETIFLIRYRYSSLYTEEVRSRREAYNGGFDKAYAVFEKRFGKFGDSYEGFLVNYIFEMTLCFAEKVITGRVKDNEETEYRIWSAVSTAAKVITKNTVCDL